MDINMNNRHQTPDIRHQPRGKRRIVNREQEQIPVFTGMTKEKREKERKRERHHEFTNNGE
jgi:hypothetical protein